MGPLSVEGARTKGPGSFMYPGVEVTQRDKARSVKVLDTSQSRKMYL